MHEKLATIVTGAVERIVHTEERAALYQRALRSVRSFARGASTLALRVSADDHAHARAALDSLKALQTQGLHIEVSVDPALRAGSCVFESEVGILDASLQTQLDGLRAAMDRAVRKALASSLPLAGAGEDADDAHHGHELAEH
jgi:type III secretion protein L